MESVITVGSGATRRKDCRAASKGKSKSGKVVKLETRRSLDVRPENPDKKRY